MCSVWPPVWKSIFPLHGQRGGPRRQRAGSGHEEMHSEVEYIVAHGIASRVGGERVVIGSYHFVFEDEHCIVPADEQEKFDRMPAEYSHLYMAASVLRQLHNLSTIGISLRSMTNLIQKPSSAPQLEG